MYVCIPEVERRALSAHWVFLLRRLILPGVIRPTLSVPAMAVAGSPCCPRGGPWLARVAAAARLDRLTHTGAAAALVS